MAQPDVLEPEWDFTTTEEIGKDGDIIIKEAPTPFESAVYNERIKTWIKVTDTLDSTLRSLYNIVWGQCSKLVQNKLTALGKLDERDMNGDVTWLLREIRSISH